MHRNLKVAFQDRINIVRSLLVWFGLPIFYIIKVTADGLFIAIRLTTYRLPLLANLSDTLPFKKVLHTSPVEFLPTKSCMYGKR